MSKQKSRRNLPAKKPDLTAIPVANGPQQQVLTQTLTFSGPIPPPDVLERYNAIVPGLADRLVVMAETEQKYRIAESGKVNDANIAMAKTSQLLQLLGIAGAFILALSFLSGAIYLAMSGHEKLAGVIATLTLGVLAGTFAVDRWNRRHQQQ